MVKFRRHDLPLYPENNDTANHKCDLINSLYYKQFITSETNTYIINIFKN